MSGIDSGGHMTFHLGGQAIPAGAGTLVDGRVGVAHAFTVEGESGARFLTVAQPAAFEGFVRELGVPATTPTLPPAGVAPPDLERMIAVAARYGMQLVGPPPEPAGPELVAASATTTPSE